MSDRLKELRERSQKRKQLLAQAVNEAKFRTVQYLPIDYFLYSFKMQNSPKNGSTIRNENVRTNSEKTIIFLPIKL